MMELRSFDRCWIMVVADDVATRRLVEDVLNQANFPTIGVATANDARAWLKAAEPDPTLMVLEGEQNVLDGVQLRDLQQHNPQQPLIHVVVLVGEGQDPTLHRDAIPQALTVLPTPVDLDRLVAIAAQHCAQHGR